MDSDCDGIVDVIEAGLPDANFNGIVDGVIANNGWSVSVSAMGALVLINTDGSGNPDYLDIDADDDGICAAGIYTVLIFVNDEMAVQKFILIK